MGRHGSTPCHWFSICLLVVHGIVPSSCKFPATTHWKYHWLIDGVASRPVLRRGLRINATKSWWDDTVICAQVFSLSHPVVTVVCAEAVHVLGSVVCAQVFSRDYTLVPAQDGRIAWLGPVFCAEVNVWHKHRPFICAQNDHAVIPA